MAADELSTAHLPPVTWTTNANDRDSHQDSAEKGKRVRGSRPKEKKASSPDIDFEPVEHELDSIA